MAAAVAIAGAVALALGLRRKSTPRHKPAAPTAADILAFNEITEVMARVEALLRVEHPGTFSRLFWELYKPEQPCILLVLRIEPASIPAFFSLDKDGADAALTPDLREQLRTMRATVRRFLREEGFERQPALIYFDAEDRAMPGSMTMGPGYLGYNMAYTL